MANGLEKDSDMSGRTHKAEGVLSTYREYRRTFFPEAERRLAKTSDPYKYGTQLARKAMRKVRQLLSQ